MSGYGSLRASDADRDAVVSRLRDAAAEGRLDPEELEERVDAALRARTYGELSRLVADLPGDTAAARPRGLARTALIGAGVVAAATVAVAVVAIVALLVVAAAAWWMVWVAVWLLCCGSRRRASWAYGPRRRVHRTRPADLL
jgi:Domain of unknown function (DUF1707)